MKTTDVITMITFLLVAITASDVVSGEKEVVLDSEGNPVKAKAPYIIRASSPNRKAFITRYTGHPPFLLRPFSPENQEPVLFSSDDKHNGPQPVVFIVDSDVVRVSTELHIHHKVPGKTSSGIWRKSGKYSLPINSIVVTESWSMDEEATFTIQKFEGAYRIAFGSADKPVTICAEMVRISQLARLRLWNQSRQVTPSCFPPVKFIPV